MPSMLYITTMAIVGLQLALDVNAGCETQALAPISLHLCRFGRCSGTRNRVGPIIFTCRGQETTITLDGALVALNALKVNSQVAIRCGTRDVWQFCQQGSSQSNVISECKNDILVWSARRFYP